MFFDYVFMRPACLLRSVVTIAFLLACLNPVNIAFAATFEIGSKKVVVKQPENPFAAPMRFAIVRSGNPGCEPTCPEWIYAMGQITPQTLRAFKAVLKKVGDRKLPLLISSPGGRVDVAMQMGQLVRKLKINVEVAQTRFPGCKPAYLPCETEKVDDVYRGYALSIGSFCLSACPLILAGGVRRVAGPLAFTGVHQITTVRQKYRVEVREKYRIINGRKKVVGRSSGKRRIVGTSVSTKLSKSIRRQLLAYFKEMGIDAGLLDAILSTPPTGIRRLTMQELTDFRLATEISMPEVFTIPDVCTNIPVGENCVRRGGDNAMRTLAAPEPARQ